VNPLAELQDAYTHAFMIRATLAAVAVALVCSVMSIFVVLRRMAFAGAGISHIAFGGVALAVLIGWPPAVGAALFGIGAAAILSRRRTRRALSEDTVIGVLFAAAMAFGVILLQFGGARNVDLMTFLFGNVLTTSPGELVSILILSGIVLGVLALFFPALVFTSFDEETAQLCGLPVVRLNVLLLEHPRRGAASRRRHARHSGCRRPAPLPRDALLPGRQRPGRRGLHGDRSRLELLDRQALGSSHRAGGVLRPGSEPGDEGAGRLNGHASLAHAPAPRIEVRLPAFVRQCSRRTR
jgi:hypothetical protein